MRPGPAPLGDFLGRRFAARSPLVSWLLFERLGGALAYVLSRFGVPPAAVTLTGGAVGVLGALRLATAERAPDVAVAGGLLLLSYVLDCTDGQLARATDRTSASGAWLDVTVDGVVIAFVSAALSIALVGNGTSPVASVLLAGAYGASRTANLLTSSLVRSDAGGLRLTGMASVARAAYVALIDTPVVYVVLCAARPAPEAFGAVIAALAVMTVVQTVVSARHHFTAGAPAPTA